MADSSEQVNTSETSSERSSGEEEDRGGEVQVGEWEEGEGECEDGGGREEVGEEEEGEGEEKVGDSKRSEEEVYSLLFCEVDSAGRGLVEVDSLVDYLSHVQLGTPRGQWAGVEDVFDSEEDVHQVQYNLQLLKAMLEEVSGVDRRVDQATYSHVIRLWVKDVRDRSNQHATPSLEVSQLSSDSEEDDADPMATPRPQLSFGYDQSFETSGGNSSGHSTLDRLDLLASLEDVRLDNRRLAERERQLQAGLEVSEEQLRGMQAENTALQSQLRSAQQQLVRLETLERDNAAIVQSLKEEGVKCEELTVAAEDMKQQLSRAQRELAATRERLREGEGERERDQDEATELQQQLLAKEEVVYRERERCEGLQAQLSGVTTAHEALRSKVVELEEANAALQRENEELHNTAVPAGPSYSTPFHSTEPPSLHDELSRHGNLSGQALPSPLVGVENGRHGYKRESCRLEDRYDYSDTSLHGNLSLEELEQMAQSSSNKFHSKTEVMVRLLSELLNTSRPLPPHPTSSHSSDSITEISHTKRQKDGNMRQLVACVKKLYSEKKQLKCQVAELQAQLEQCRHEEVDAAVQTTPPLAVATPTEPIKPTLVAATQTEPLPPLLVHRSPLAMCAHFVSRVTRGIAWAMFLLVLLLLLLCLVVWVQAEVRPCCCGGLSPGSMVWALLQPQVTVTHHGHI